MSRHHLNFQEGLTRRIFQIEWVEKCKKLKTIIEKLDSCNDEGRSRIWNEVGVISGEFNPKDSIAILIHFFIKGELLSMLETSPWAYEFMESKDKLLQLKIRSIEAEMDKLVKRHEIQREEVEIKGVKQSFLRWSAKNEAEADEFDACMGEMVKL